MLLDANVELFTLQYNKDNSGYSCSDSCIVHFITDSLASIDDVGSEGVCLTLRLAVTDV